MKAVKKLLEKWEQEKRTPKTKAYYEKLLGSFDLETLKKLKKIIDLLDEEIKLDVSCGKYEPPYAIGIETNKFEKANLLLSDVKKILNLFSDSKYLLIPPLPDNQNQKEIIIYSPINDFSTALQDWCFKYPYEENFANFKRALYEITAQESSIESEELNLDKLDFHKALFLLRTLYRKMLDMLEAFCARGYFTFRNEVINFYYVSFKETINQILEMKGFEGLKKEVPELFDSLIGDIEEADMDWEYGYSQMAYKFLGKIESLYIKSGTKSFKLPQVLENKLKEADRAIAAHKEYDKKLWERTEKSLDKMKKDFDWGDSSKKVNQIGAKARAEEIKRQFKELNEKQKERETFKKEIIEEVSKKIPKEPFPITIKEMPELKIKGVDNGTKLKEQLKTKIKLNSQKIEFNDNEAIIKIGKQNVALPPYKNEHYFCQAVFEYKPKESISWDIIYDQMTGHSIVNAGRKPEPVRENWQKVNDTMKRINNRIKEIVNTDDNLFSWSEKTVIRNY